MLRKQLKTLCAGLALLALIGALALSIVVQAHPAYAASSVTINGATTYQTIDGFGASEAFGQADAMINAGSTLEKQMLDLLFSPTTGAGLTILRNLIPSDSNHTIEPNSPGSPTATPQYVPIGTDWGQLPLTQQVVQNYGVTRIYADAWSAPGFMKTNGSESNGGTLCGAPGAATCSTGDWRQAYANYLVQYIKDYQAAGVTITNIGFVNEPNLSTSYSSMVMNPTQTADFAKILGPTLANAGLSTQIVCCDAEGWDLAPSYTSAIVNDATANSYVKVISSHGYTAAPTSPLNSNGKPVWETEWSTFDSFDAAWDDGSDASGLTWAQHIHVGLTSANLSAFLYWWGVASTSVSTDNQGLIQLNGSTITPSKRLWAFANYSRFIRPGAVRIGASSSDSNLLVSAYRNTNGTLAIVVINLASSDTATTFSLQNTNVANGATVTPYLTNNNNNTAAQATLSVSNGSFSATVPARSLVTYVIPAGTGGGTPTPTPAPTSTPTPAPSPSPTATPSPTPAPTSTPTPTPTPGASCQVHYSVVSQWPGGFQGSITITNTGSSPINGWTLSFSFTAGQQITQLWNGSYTQQGAQVTITNASYNAQIPAGATLGASPGFLASWNGSNPAPTSFTLNGATCSVV
ncbi:MAG: cellulose binding domain-containing protein [Thermogemmatispora sp.]|uniref:cellulose binding domain-containing protein n=1 Tax=Thermogemmatispora sp. TaxID=1968838 RepID=UPI002639DD05|nr:cellulose binding domain-containing protein [Thermogemmatispora sp.]MBX5458419.1 cellulose binding domain-containing protein [Thermogemmatispora sp.]